MILKIFGGFIAVYLIFVIILYFSYSSKYSYKSGSVLIQATTYMLQPFMQLFGNSKVTHFWHWEKYAPAYDYALFGIKRDNPAKRIFKAEFDLWAFLVNAQADLGGVKEAIVVKPKNYTGKWRLVYCVTQEKLFCEVGILNHSGEVKILNDGVGYTWGLDENNQPLKLELVRQIEINQEKNILFI